MRPKPILNNKEVDIDPFWVWFFGLCFRQQKTQPQDDVSEELTTADLTVRRLRVLLGQKQQTLWRTAMKGGFGRILPCFFLLVGFILDSVVLTCCKKNV